MSRLHKIILAVLLLALMMFVIAGLQYHKASREVRQFEFLSLYLPEEAVRALMQWSNYYGFRGKWLEVFALLMTESNGVRRAKSHKDCHGYMMLQTRTAGYLRERLRDIISDVDIYSTEFNIAGGLLHLRSLVDNQCDGDFTLAIEHYNTGSYNYVKGIRAPAHMTRYGINLTYYKYAYNNFRRAK